MDFFDFPVPKPRIPFHRSSEAEERRTPHLLSSRREERRTPHLVFLATPASSTTPHLVPSALLSLDLQPAFPPWRSVRRSRPDTTRLSKHRPASLGLVLRCPESPRLGSPAWSRLAPPPCAASLRAVSREVCSGWGLEVLFT